MPKHRHNGSLCCCHIATVMPMFCRKANKIWDRQGVQRELWRYERAVITLCLYTQQGYAFGSLLLYVAATLLLLCQCFAGKRTRSEMDKVSKESCEGMRELLLPCACILSRVMHLVVCSCNFLTLLSRSLIIQQWCHHDGCLKIYFQVSCHGFMATLKAILPRLSSGSAGIVDLNHFKEYVKPFSREINATHDEQCYYKADWLIWSRWRFRSVRLVFVDAFTSF